MGTLGYVRRHFATPSWVSRVVALLLLNILLGVEPIISFVSIFVEAAAMSYKKVCTPIAELQTAARLAADSAF
jgi:hypothetical protein